MASVSASTPDCAEIKFDGDNLLELNDAQDTSVSPATDIEGATVTADLEDVTDPDNPVTLAISPLTLTEFPSSPSNDYRVSFFASAANGFSVGQRVKIDIDFNGGAGLRQHFVFVAIVCE